MGSGEAEDVQDVPVEEAWARLAADPGSVLIDVRSRAEWAFVGLPDLSSLGKRVVTMEWQTFPEGRIDPAFSDRLTEILAAAGAGSNQELLFICRSGARSRMAAAALATAGFKNCRNVAEGFEGQLDGNRQRGRISGWKAKGLPWIQG